MRIVVALMLGLFLAATAYAASSPGSRSGKPELAVSSGLVHGAHFAPRERVLVAVRGGERVAWSSTRTSASGRFTTALPYADPCLGPLVVTAKGATGDTASLKLPQRACAPD